MEEYNNLIDELNKVLNKLSSITDLESQIAFFQENSSLFIKFKYSLNTILTLYHFKEKGNPKQNTFSDKLQYIITLLLQHGSFLKDIPQFEYFISTLLDSLGFSEGKFAFKLQYETDFSNAEIAIEYIKTRMSYLKLLYSNAYFEGQDFNNPSALQYKATKYEENVIGHALMQIQKTFLNMKKEDIIRLLQCIDFSDFFSELFAKSKGKIDFYDSNLIYQYTNTILKLKSIFIPSELENDPFIQAMWNGNIKDPQTLQSIFKNISLDGLLTLSGYYNTETEIPFLVFLADHFKEVNYSNQNIAIILVEILNKGISSYQIAELLADIDIPENLREFLDSKHAKKYPYLLEGAVFDTLKSREEIIESGKRPFLPAEYYIKKLNSNSFSSVDEHFVQNLITLLHSDYYTEDEKKALTNTLKENNLYSPYISTETITFSDTDSPQTVYHNILRSYYSGQIIPLNVATSLINDFISGSISNDITQRKKVLEACVQSIISHTLAEKRN